MCTLIMAFYPGTPTPLVVGANRDENPNRPSSPWQERKYGNVAVYSPLDVLGGTWIGCNEFGLFAAITNWDLNMNLRGRGMKSRGNVVLETLQCVDMDMAVEYWRTLNAKEYKPFNIFCCSSYHMMRLQCNHEEMVIKDGIAPGLYVSTGLGFETGCIREDTVKKQLKRAFWDFSQPVKQNDILWLLPNHNSKVHPEDSICVHDESHRWETRSSCTLVLDSDSNWDVMHTNTAPCKVQPQDWSRNLFLDNLNKED